MASPVSHSGATNAMASSASMAWIYTSWVYFKRIVIRERVA